VGFFEGEKIKDYKCPECDKQVEVTKKFSFLTFPQTLIISLKRFRFNHATLRSQKIHDRFEYPTELDLKPFMLFRDEAEHKFNLVGVVVHSGNADEGHYYSFIQERDSQKWYKFDDTNVCDFDPSNLGAQTYGGNMPQSGFFRDRSTTAYMLIYERKQKA